MNLLCDYTKVRRIGNCQVPKEEILIGFVFFGGGGGETKSKSSLEPAQREMLGASADVIMPYLKGNFKNTPYSGDLTVEPDSRALGIMNSYLDNPELLNQQDLQALDTLVKGEPAYTYNAKEWADTWAKEYAAPLTNAWSQYTMPAIAESMNVTPGSFFATETANVVGNKANEFFGQYVAPSLFTTRAQMEQLSAQSKDTARGFSLDAIKFKSSLPQLQTVLASSLSDWNAGYKRLNQQNLYQEAQRMMPENSNWLQMALNNSTKPTVDTVVQPESGIPGALIGAGGTAAGAAIIAI